MKKDARVQQEDDMGCAIAAMAMATGKSYKQMRDIVAQYWDVFRTFEAYKGMTTEDEKIILYRMGFKQLGLRPIKNGEMRDYIGETACILTLPSLNVPGLFHACFWDGKVLHDPSPLKQYTADKAWEVVKEAKVIIPMDGASFLYGLKGEDNPEHHKKFTRAKLKRKSKL